jgi:hypothetical protein
MSALSKTVRLKMICQNRDLTDFVVFKQNLRDLFVLTAAVIDNFQGTTMLTDNVLKDEFRDVP